MSPPASPAAVATSTTTARLSLPWLAATPAAVSAVAPMAGMPAHEAATARKRSRYCHQVSAATPAVARTMARRGSAEAARGGDAARAHVAGDGSGAPGAPGEADAGAS